MSASNNAPANAPGKTMLQVVSIIFIVFGAIATIVSIIALAGSALLTAAVGGFGALFLVVSIIALASGVLELIIGILGLKKSKDPSKANFFIGWGIAMCVINLITMILSFLPGAAFSWTSLIGFILPVLYIVGGVMNKKAVTAA
jgi:hypothetical protein